MTNEINIDDLTPEQQARFRESSTYLRLAATLTAGELSDAEKAVREAERVADNAKISFQDLAGRIDADLAERVQSLNKRAENEKLAIRIPLDEAEAALAVAIQKRDAKQVELLGANAKAQAAEEAGK